MRRAMQRAIGEELKAREEAPKKLPPELSALVRKLDRPNEDPEEK